MKTHLPQGLSDSLPGHFLIKNGLFLGFILLKNYKAKILPKRSIKIKFAKIVT